MQKSTHSRVWIEIDLRAIRQNYRRIAQSVKPATVMAVLKANAYGLGIEPIAKTLIDAGVCRIGVASLEEALPLAKKNHIQIQILGSMVSSEIPEAIKYNIICPVTDINMAQAISKEAAKQGKKAIVHLLIDTGMGRLGIPYDGSEIEIKKCMASPHLQVEGVYSHFANANNPHHPKTKEQVQLFKDLLRKLKPETFPLIHLANSDAINNFKDTYFNMVRTGINLYGVFDLLGRRTYNLKPTLALKTKLIAKRLLPAGTTIGYGCTHTLFKETLVGTIPAGYADGIPTSAGNSALVLIAGKECPIIGQVSMDYTTIDLSQHPQAKRGDIVTIIGRSKDREITVEDWAKNKQSHPYDVICSLGNRVARVYKNG